MLDSRLPGQLELLVLLAAGVILILASMVQSVVGFGYALLATPLPIGNRFAGPVLRQVA